jgi:hypothetical protein
MAGRNFCREKKSLVCRFFTPHTVGCDLSSASGLLTRMCYGGKRFVVRADEKLTSLPELEAAILTEQGQKPLPCHPFVSGYSSKRICAVLFEITSNRPFTILGSSEVKLNRTK